MYFPVLQSELHIDIIDKLIKEKSMCFYGDYGCGKTTCIMKTLNFLNYEITYINEYKETLKETLSTANNVMSFFLNKKFVIILDDYPFKYTDDSNLFIIYITNKKLNKIESFNIPSPNTIFLNLLAYNVLYLENKEYIFNSRHDNFRTFWSDLDFSLQFGKQINSDFFFKPNNKDYIKLINNKSTINDKIIASDHIHSYKSIQNKIIEKINNIDKMADALEYMSCAIQGTPEYGILSIVAPCIYI
jgi:hypothetical protein